MNNRNQDRGIWASFFRRLRISAPGLEDTCTLPDRLLSLYGDGQCTPRQTRIVDEHLAGCEDCRRSLAIMRISSAAILGRPAAEAPAYLSERLRQALAIEMSRAARAAGSHDRVASGARWAGGVLAVAVISGIAFFVHSHGTPIVTTVGSLPPSPAASTHTPIDSKQGAAVNVARVPLTVARPQHHVYSDSLQAERPMVAEFPDANDDAVKLARPTIAHPVFTVPHSAHLEVAKLVKTHIISRPRSLPTEAPANTMIAKLPDHTGEPSVPQAGGEPDSGTVVIASPDAAPVAAVASTTDTDTPHMILARTLRSLARGTQHAEQEMLSANTQSRLATFSEGLPIVHGDVH